MNKFKKYIISLAFLVMFPIIISASLNILFMFKINEFTKIDDVIEAQQNGKVLFNGLLNQSPYKSKMAELTQPIIISFGSSRSFGVREFFFKKSFYNLGGGLPETEQTLKGFLRSPGSAFNKLRYVLIYLDFWAFMIDGVDEKVAIQAIKKNKIRQKKVKIDFGAYPEFKNTWLYRLGRASILPFSLMESGVLTFDGYIGVLSGNISDQLDGIKKIGYGAVFAETGFGVDGSYYYLYLRNNPIVTEKCSLAGQWEAKKKFVHGAYRPGQKVDPRKIEKLATQLRILEENGITGIPIIPPMASSLLDYIDREPSGYEHIDEWRTLMKEKIPAVWDFHDLRDIGVSECEMIDDIHAGDILHMRMIREIAKNDPDFRAMLEVDRIDSLIEEFSGRRNVRTYGLRKAINYGKIDAEVVRIKAATLKRKVLIAKKTTQEQARPKLTRSERLRQMNVDRNDAFLANNPDFELRLFELVKQTNRRTVGLTRTLGFGFLIIIIVLPGIGYLIMRRVSHDTALAMLAGVGPGDQKEATALRRHDIEDRLNRISRHQGDIEDICLRVMREMDSPSKRAEISTIVSQMKAALNSASQR